METNRPSSLADERATLRAAARGVAGWTTVAALLLLYFGYSVFTGIPDDSVAPQRQGWWLFFYGLRVGGILLALSAVVCWSGLPRALCVDALASGTTGLALVASGVLIYTDNSTQAFLNVLFGALFVHGGYRSWREYHTLAATVSRPAPATARRERVPEPAAAQPIGRAKPVRETPPEAERPREPEEGRLASFARRREDERQGPP